MKAVILAGGLGTRLRPLTYVIPKPLIPIKEKPILQIIVERLKSYGFEDFIFATGYNSHLIEIYFGDGSDFKIKITYIKEKKPLGTAGVLSMIEDKFSKDESFLIMNGDIITKLNFSKMVEHHYNKKNEITVGVRKYKQQLPFGVLSIKQGIVYDVKEKPIEEYDIIAGIYIVKATVLKDVPKDSFVTMPDVIKKMIDQKRSLGTYLIEEDWFALEQISQIEEANGKI
ncbi:MAG: sugar phosphate nucleotidyltransferase [Sedimentisphaerales bacterium]|jgi:NDP-sugar pyrophosphorylase family protein